MVDKLFESVYNLFEEDEEKVNYERSDVEISPVVYSVELYVNDKLQEDYYEKFENKDEAIEYGKKLLNMIGKNEKFTVSVLSHNTESGKIKVEWRETNQKWGEGFFEADENDEMKSILESTGYYDELSDIHNTGLAGNYDETLEKVSKEDYKELKDEKAVQIEGLNESISEEAQEKLWKNGFLFDIDQYHLGLENERDYVKSYTDRENNISWRPYLGNEEKDMFYIKGDHSGKLYSLDEIIDIKKGIKKLDESVESIKVGDIFQNEYGTRIIIVVYEPEDDYVMFRIGENLTKDDLDSASVEAKTTTIDGIKNILNHNGYQPINLNKTEDLNESVNGNSFEVIVFSEDEDGRVNILDEKILDNKESAIEYAKEKVISIENASYANVYRLDQIENLDTGNFEEDPVVICQVDENQHVQYLMGEATEKQNGKWVNKGKEGTHGTFKTKKEADAQRKAMFANGYKG